MKRLIIDGDWQHAHDHGGPTDDRWHLHSSAGSYATVFVNDPNVRVTVEEAADPLPTEPGTHIIATVTRGGVTARVVCARLYGDAEDTVWRSAWPVDNEVAHHSGHLTDWQVLALDRPDGAA